MKKPNRQDLFELDFFEKIRLKNPKYVDVLMQLGQIYTRLGRYDEGIEVDRTLSRLCPSDPTVHYNLACSYALMRDRERALESLQKSLELGYRDWKYLMSDPDLEELRKDARFPVLVRRYKGRSRPAKRRYSPG